MQEFKCPQCRHVSTYDPWAESARCPQCGFVPQPGKRTHRRLAKKLPDTHHPLLDELRAMWENTYTPDKTFSIETPDLAVLFFRDYQYALGEDPGLSPGKHLRYIRNYHPGREQILGFVGAYLLLRRGLRQQAERRLHDMTYLCPKFADLWVWRTATTDDPAERREYLEQALLHEPAHPLARDAMAILRGTLSDIQEGPTQAQPRVEAIDCPQCGGSLRYQAGASEVRCPFCGLQFPLHQADVIEETAPLVGDLRLRRHYQGFVWREVDRVMRCQPCGGRLTMTHRLAERCPFCGSTNVLVEENPHSFEQPDGFVPFQVVKEQAGEIIQRKLRSGLRMLKAWFGANGGTPGLLQGLYIPFWVFDGFVEIRTWRSSIAQPAPSDGQTQPTDLIMLDNLIFPGVDNPAPRLLRKLFPFDPKAMVRYEAKLLADWPAALYERDVEDVVEDAYAEMLQLARLRAPALIEPGQSESGTQTGPTAYRRSFQVSATTYQLILLPVWVQAIAEGDRQRLAIVNGQTGKAALGKAESLKAA